MERVQRDSSVLYVEYAVGRGVADRGVHATAYINALLQALAGIVRRQVTPVGEDGVTGGGIGQTGIVIPVVGGRAEVHLAV